jgi:hypothetical protein
MPADTDAHKRLADAFRTFEESLQQLLVQEARSSVDGALERLSVTTGPFRINDVEVDVVIRNLSVEAVPDHTGASPRPRRRPKRAAAPRRRAAKSPGRAGRPPGALRTALIETFSGTDAELDTDGIRAELDTRGVKASRDNLHQQLRRLVAAGILQRSGRGRYRRA